MGAASSPVSVPEHFPLPCGHLTKVQKAPIQPSYQYLSEDNSHPETVQAYFERFLFTFQNWHFPNFSANFLPIAL